VVLGRRRLVGAAVTAAAAVALAWAVGGKGCGESDSTPEGAARAFVAAARAEDKAALWELLGPATRGRATAAAAAATEKVGGARRFAPLEVLDVGAPESTYVPTDIVLREVRGANAFVDVLGPEGRRDTLQLVEVGGRWRVELEFQN
jgi:hypothetical protein